MNHVLFLVRKDSEGVKNDPYLVKMHYTWIRNNEVERIVVKDTAFGKVGECEK